MDSGHKQGCNQKPHVKTLHEQRRSMPHLFVSVVYMRLIWRNIWKCLWRNGGFGALAQYYHWRQQREPFSQAGLDISELRLKQRVSATWHFSGCWGTACTNTIAWNCCVARGWAWPWDQAFVAYTSITAWTCGNVRAWTRGRVENSAWCQEEPVPALPSEPVEELTILSEPAQKITSDRKKRPELGEWPEHLAETEK